MIKNKKILLTITTSIIMAITILGMTIAFFTSKDEVANIFKVGEIDIEVEEKFPKDPPPWNKGKIEKVVNIKNITSNNDALIRVNITPRWLEESDENEIPWSGDASEKVVKLKFSNIIKPSQNTPQKWVDGGDGYYYYTSILKAQENTSDILESVEVTVNEDTVENTKDYEGKVLKVDVNAEAVQPTKQAYEDTWNIQNESIKSLLNNLIQKHK